MSVRDFEHNVHRHRLTSPQVTGWYFAGVDSLTQVDTTPHFSLKLKPGRNGQYKPVAKARRVDHTEEKRHRVPVELSILLDTVDSGFESVIG